eukprot:4498022-Pyramimonas_sp.AAC.2
MLCRHYYGGDSPVKRRALSSLEAPRVPADHRIRKPGIDDGVSADFSTELIQLPVGTFCRTSAVFHVATPSGRVSPSAAIGCTDPIISASRTLKALLLVSASTCPRLRPY